MRTSKSGCYRGISRIPQALALVAGISAISCSAPVPSSPLPPSSSVSAGSVDARIVSYSNASRASVGKKALQRDAFLDSLAQEHARVLMKQGRLSHSGLQGQLARAHQKIGATMFAENVHSVRKGGDPARRLVEEWIASRVHRDNLLSGAFNKTGVGSATDSAGIIWAVQVFAATP